MKVLILTGKFGMGHVAAAEAMADRLRGQYADAEIRIVDLMEYIYPKLHPYIYRAFNAVVNKMPRIYNAMICLDCYLSKLPFRGKWVSGDIVGDLVAQWQPDVLVSTWLIGSKYVGAYKKKTGDDIPFITCITDILAFDEWLSPSTDAYIVGGEETKEALIAKGVDAHSIYVGGIPVRRAFGSCGSSAAGEGKEVLMMGGGLGFIPGAEELLSALDAMPGVHTTVITGRNKKLYEKLRGKYRHVDVRGFTREIPALMAAADVLVTKAGGATTFEAIWAELPLFVAVPYFEQEKVNAAYVEEKELGQVVWERGTDGAEALKALLQDRDRRQRIKEHMRAMKEQMNSCGIERLMDTLLETRERKGRENHEEEIHRTLNSAGGLHGVCAAASGCRADEPFYPEASGQNTAFGRCGVVSHV